jgi:tetratricopeptide (TPR) repeat protein
MARKFSKRSLLFLLPALTLASWFVFTSGAISSESEELTKTVVQLYAAGQYRSAIPLAERALDIQEKALGPEHPDVATALNNLASLYRYDGQLALAESLYRRALDIDERALGPDHAQVARDLSNLASLYDSEGRFADAEPLYEWALASDEKALGPDDPAVATDLTNLASLYESEQRYADAQPLRERALAIREKAVGPGHPGIAMDLNSLASLYARQGRYAEAESTYKRALAVQEKALGPNDPDLAATLNNLGSLYDTLNRPADAESSYTRASAIEAGQSETATRDRSLPAKRPRPSAPAPHVAPPARLEAATAGAPPPASANANAAPPSAERPLSCEASGAEPSRAVENFLPWPPPKGSDQKDVTAAVLSAIHRPLKDLLLGDIDKYLTDTLTPAKLQPLAYFSTPDRNGYAAVTHLEQIDDNGHRLDGPYGFSTDVPESGNILWRFFHDLVTLPEGKFRLLVAFVTPQPIDSWYSPDPVTVQIAKTWVSKGCDDLPRELAKLHMTEDYKIFLRVYQIASKGRDSHLVSKAEAIPISDDLLAWGIHLDGQK